MVRRKNAPRRRTNAAICPPATSAAESRATAIGTSATARNPAASDTRKSAYASSARSG